MTNRRNWEWYSLGNWCVGRNFSNYLLRSNERNVARKASPLPSSALFSSAHELHFSRRGSELGHCEGMYIITTPNIRSIFRHNKWLGPRKNVDNIEEYYCMFETLVANLPKLLRRHRQTRTSRSFTDVFVLKSLSSILSSSQATQCIKRWNTELIGKLFF